MAALMKRIQDKEIFGNLIEFTGHLEGSVMLKGVQEKGDFLFRSLKETWTFKVWYVVRGVVMFVVFGGSFSVGVKDMFGVLLIMSFVRYSCVEELVCDISISEFLAAHVVTCEVLLVAKSALLRVAGNVLILILVTGLAKSSEQQFNLDRECKMKRYINRHPLIQELRYKADFMGLDMIVLILFLPRSCRRGIASLHKNENSVCEAAEFVGKSVKQKLMIRRRSVREVETPD
ncbi:hypothetical protein Tco_0612594 [Tanacetum coccineum]